MIERAYQAQQQALPIDEHDRLFALFLEHYGANIPGQSQPYPGVVEALDRFARPATCSRSAPTRPRTFPSACWSRSA